MNAKMRLRWIANPTESELTQGTALCSMITRILDAVDDWEHNRGLMPCEFFSEYESPYKDIGSFSASNRLYEFKKIIMERKRKPEDWANYFLFPKDRELWGNLYFGVFKDRFNIHYAAECLGFCFSC